MHTLLIPTASRAGGLLEGVAPVKLLDPPVIDRAAAVRLALAARANSGRMVDSA
jgi:hypothetical protein